MAWNEPGSGRGGDKNDPDKGNQNPWGRGNREPGPPDLDQLLKKLAAKLKKMLNFPMNVKRGRGQGGSGSGGFGGFGGFGQGPGGFRSGFTEIGSIALVIGIVILAIYLFSGIYIVEPPERAVITRFGKYVRTEGAGPHWLLPIIESKEVVNVEQVSTSDHSGLMLTRDRNIASVGVAVQYRIGDGEDDLRAYLFNVANPILSLKMATESALRHVIGQSTMDEVLTLRRAEIATAIKQQLIETLNGYHTGIEVIDVAMQFAKAPDEVRAAFDDVIKAAADEERLTNQARAYENEVLPRARGTVEQLKNGAMGYKEETILIAEGNVQRFNSILPQYQKAPKVTQTRLYLETLEQIFSKTSKVLIDSSLGNNLIYLPFDKLVPAVTSSISGGTEGSNNLSSSNSPASNNPLSTAPAYQKEKNS